MVSVLSQLAKDNEPIKPESIPEKIFKSASALVLTAYLVRCKPVTYAQANYESDRIREEIRCACCFNSWY